MLSRTTPGAIEEINKPEVKGETESAANGVFHLPKSLCLPVCEKDPPSGGPSQRNAEESNEGQVSPFTLTSHR